MAEQRPQLPSDLKREVRQRCGFGCVICGRPIYEYDHILGWAKVKRHLASEITLLCDNHHREKTAGFLPDEIVIKANQGPFNVQHGMTALHTLHYSGDQFLFKVGGIEFGGVVSCDAIRVDGEPILSARLEDGHFLLSLKVYDSSDDLILLIKDNELLLNARLWDIEVVGSRITLREGQGAVLFDVLFQPPSSLIVMRGRFLRKGAELLVARKYCVLLNNCLRLNMAIKNCSVGIDLGNGLPPSKGVCAVHIDGFPRYGWDREGAIRWVRSQVASLPQVTTAVDDLLNAGSLS